MKLEIEKRNPERRPYAPRPRMMTPRPRSPIQRTVPTRRTSISLEQKSNFKKMLEDLIGTRGAYILDQNLTILGKVPITELTTTISNLNSVFAVILDGDVSTDIVQTAERANVRYLIGKESEIAQNNSRIEIFTNNDFA